MSNINLNVRMLTLELVKSIINETETEKTHKLYYIEIWYAKVMIENVIEQKRGQKEIESCEAAFYLVPPIVVFPIFRLRFWSILRTRFYLK